jgi:tetratricopeptide (TPR) repeat protein
MVFRNIVLLLFIVNFLYGYDDTNIKNDYLQSYNYEKMGKYKEAIKVLTPLYNKYPKGYTLNLRFGWLFYLNKNYNDAIKYYKKALLVSPYSLDLRLGLTRIYLDTQSFEKALEKAYEILKIDYYNYYANIYAIQALIAQKNIKLLHK